MFDMLPFDEHLKMLKEKYDRECKCSEYLREELNKVKDESFKDSELKKMKQELETMRKEYYRGFPISKSEEERIDEFMKSITKYMVVIMGAAEEDLLIYFIQRQ